MPKSCCPVTRRLRIASFAASGLLAALLTVLGSSALLPASAASAARTGPGEVPGQHIALADSWPGCNDDAVRAAPKVIWSRIQQATEQSGRLPVSFWKNSNYREDIARIICYESTYNWHAQNGGQYGWFQMNRSLIQSEGVSFKYYWYGTKDHPAGWHQCLAGELYILRRYGNPSVAWGHERDYGWY